MTKTATRPSMMETELRSALKKYREALSHIDVGLRNPDLYEIEVGRAERRILTLFGDLTRCVCGRLLSPGLCRVCDNDD